MSEERNSFKRLDDDDRLPPNGEKELNGSISLISSVSRVIELYLPGFFQLLISMSGGGSEKKLKAPNNNSEGGEIKRDNENSPSEPPK